MPMDERSTRVYSAKLAEQAERYFDMRDAIKSVVIDGNPLTTEERNLLSVAYKNLIGNLRSSWRTLTDVPSTEDKVRAKLIHQVEKELTDVSDDVIMLLDEHLIKPNIDADSSVFYLKMKGDYYRYKAEFLTGDEKKAAVTESERAYEAAKAIADTVLLPTNPIRLGLALNYSVFHYEITGNSDMACEIAKSAFDLAINQLDQLSEDNYKDSTLILQLLRDNLTLWTSNVDVADAADPSPDEQS